MKKINLLIILSFISCSLMAQQADDSTLTAALSGKLTSLNISKKSKEKFRQNTMYAQFLGNGIVLSANYERQLFKKPGLSVHAGFGVCGETGFNWNNSSRLTIPVGVNYLLPLKKNNRFVDFGIGATYAKSDMQVYMLVDYRNSNYVNTNYWSFVPSISYRIHTPKHMMYRYGITPVINQHGFIPFFEFCAGKSF